MGNYIDLVACFHNINDRKCYVFQAPAWSCLAEGDKVIVETSRGEQVATVIKSVTVEKDSEYYKFICEVSGATMPLKKVLMKIIYSEFNYEGDEDGTDNN